MISLLTGDDMSSLQAIRRSVANESEALRVTKTDMLTAELARIT